MKQPTTQFSIYCQDEWFGRSCSGTAATLREAKAIIAEERARLHKNHSYRVYVTPLGMAEARGQIVYFEK